MAVVTSLAVVTCGGNSASNQGRSSDAGGGGTSGNGAGGSGANEGGTGVGAGGTGGTTSGGTGGGGAGVGAAGAGGTSMGGTGMGGSNACLTGESECPEMQQDPGESLCLTRDLYCATYDCDPTLDDSLVRQMAACDEPTQWPRTLKRGCGFATVGFTTSILVEWQVFDEGTGELVGAMSSSDTNASPCRSSAGAYESGTQFPDCAEAVSCRLCAADSLAPLCRFDCDCDSIDPGIDPCFAGGSCECYCSELAATAGR